MGITGDSVSAIPEVFYVSTQILFWSDFAMEIVWIAQLVPKTFCVKRAVKQERRLSYKKPPLNHRWHIFRVVDEDDLLGDGVRDCRRQVANNGCTLVANSAYFLCLLHLYLFLSALCFYIDVLIIRCGLHLGVGATRTSDDLRDFLLLLIELQLYQEFGEYRIDSIQGDARVSQLMFGIQCIPDVADCTVVLDDSTHGLYHKSKQSSRMNILLGLIA